MKPFPSLLFLSASCIVFSSSCSFPFLSPRSDIALRGELDSIAHPKPIPSAQHKSSARSRSFALSQRYKGGSQWRGKTAGQLVVRTTAYSHGERDHIIYKRQTAAGNTLRYGNTVRSAAADWSKFPVGTEFKITGEPGITYIVDDYGSALVGTETIDLYKPSIRSMNSWGVRHVNIEVTRWGSFEQSLEIMLPRSRYHHVRRMIDSIAGTKKA